MRSLWRGLENYPEAVALDNLLKVRRDALQASSQAEAGPWVVTGEQLIEYIIECEDIILKALDAEANADASDGGAFLNVLIQIDCTHLKVTERLHTKSTIPFLESKIEYDLTWSEFCGPVRMRTMRDSYI